MESKLAFCLVLVTLVTGSLGNDNTIERLERSVHELQASNAIMQRQIKALHDKVTHENALNMRQQHALNHQHTVIEQQKAAIKGLHEVGVTALKGEVEDIKAAMDVGLRAHQTSVAFSAARTNNLVNVDVDTVIVYPGIQFNIGTGYDVSNGEFRAPMGGLYQFNTIHRWNSFDLSLRVNGTSVQRVLAGDSALHRASGAASALVELGMGDVVTVVLSGAVGSRNLECEGADDCQFQGILLHEIP